MLAATPLVLLYSQWRMWQLNMQRPAETQERELLWLVRKAASTRFGRDHHFASIMSVQDFQNRVPIRSYEALWNGYWKTEFPELTDCTWPGTIPYFALTAGTTTGVTKYIPCSREMLDANFRGAGDLLFHHLLHRPTSQILGGKAFILGGSTDLREESPGIYSGDLSGIEANEIPWWLRPYTFPPRALALLTDWKEKVDKLARLSLEEDIRAISGTPNWLLICSTGLPSCVRTESRGFGTITPGSRCWFMAGSISNRTPSDSRSFWRVVGPSCGRCIRRVKPSSPSRIAARAKGCA